MDLYYDIKPRHAESFSVLLVGISSIKIDRDGYGMDNKPFSRITISYFNNHIEKISFRTGDDKYATEVCSEIKLRSANLLKEFAKGDIATYFNL